MNELELLSPAGNLDILKAVVDAGADAVYFGGDLFGARAYAKNFSVDEAKCGIDYAHSKEAKAYLTVNTLLKNTEIERSLYDYIKAHYENGIDAFIVQDFGVIDFIESYFPDSEIHVSTQATISNKYGFEFFDKYKTVSRIVLPRELSLDEISSINKSTNLEIEAFCHGALCVCYSGQCLYSSMIGQRSGNRGRCAQPCRLPYSLWTSKGEKIDIKGDFLLSPKDYCTIEQLPQMAKAGVYSFKIEGRMKQLEYAKGVVSIYRKYMDMYLENQDYAVSKHDMENLYNLGNRGGFTSLYLNSHNGRALIANNDSSHHNNNVDLTEYEYNKKLMIEGHFFAKENSPITFNVIYKDYVACASMDAAETATSNPTTIEAISGKLKKTGNTPFEFKNIEFDMDENLFIPISKINDLKRRALDDLENQISSFEKKEVRDFSELNDIHFDSDFFDDGLYVFVRTKEQLETVKNYNSNLKVCISTLLWDQINDNINTFDEIFLDFPRVLRNRGCDFIEKNIDLIESDKVKGVFVHSIDALGFLESISYPKEKIILSEFIYTMNNRSINNFVKNGYESFVIPYELNQKEIYHRFNDKGFINVYGRTPLMVMANCSKKNFINCDKKSELLYLKDRKGVDFLILNNCLICYNEIYNSIPNCLFNYLDNLENNKIKKHIISFTNEDKLTVKKVIDAYFSKEKIEPCSAGHFKRGVE